MNNERLLFVDDDPIARKSFARAMRQRGFLVDVAKDADEALELAQLFPYAIVATDLDMPGVDGMQLIEQIRSMQPDPVCLLVTGSNHVEVERVAARCNVPVVKKPWNGDELALKLQIALSGYQARLACERDVPELPASELGIAVVILDADVERATQLERLLEVDAARKYQVTRAANFDELSIQLGRPKPEICFIRLPGEGSQPEQLIASLHELVGDTAVIVLGEPEDPELPVGLVQDYIPDHELQATVLRRAIIYARDRRQVARRLAFASRHDALTNLANRLLLQERLHHAIARARRKDKWVGVLFLDLDRFKAINDSLGHDVGDQLLTQVASRLYESVRETDTVARLSGDEFAIIMEDVKSQTLITRLAQRLLNSFATPFRLGGHDVVTTTSIGIALFPENGDDTDRLLKCADTAMNRAKETGRNNYQFYGEALHRRAMQRLQLEAELRRAIEEEQFVLHYQPQVELGAHRIKGIEALLRWQRPGGELCSPLDFVPTLEETGLIVPVGEWVLRRACADMQRLVSLGFPGVRLSVNVSAVQFEDADFVDVVRQLVGSWGMPAEMLELEITEGMLIREDGGTKEALHALARLGVRVAVDDFGTGYCTLLTLKRFDIDTLKIDRSFLKDVTSNEDDASIASAVIALAKGLNMNIIAEGVERGEQERWLTERNCLCIQGFYVSQPLPFDQLLDFLSAWHSSASPKAPLPQEHSAVQRLPRPTRQSELPMASLRQRR